MTGAPSWLFRSVPSVAPTHTLHHCNHWQDIRDLVLQMLHHQAGLEYRLVFVASFTSLTLSCSQNTHNIQKLVVLLVPGLTSTVLSLPPLPTSATKNPDLPIAIPLPLGPLSPVPSSPLDLPSSIDPCSEEAAALYGSIPFITRTFSHACPIRAPSDVSSMHSGLNTFFQAPVSGEEQKRRL